MQGSTGFTCWRRPAWALLLSALATFLLGFAVTPAEAKAEKQLEPDPCRQCPGCNLAGETLQLLPFLGRPPAARYKRFLDTTKTPFSAFNAYIDTADKDEMTFSLQNVFQNPQLFRNNTKDQVKLYRIAAFGPDGIEEVRVFFLARYDKCSSTWSKPPNIEGYVLLNVAVGDYDPKAQRS